MKFLLELKFSETATLEIEAKSLKEAKQKWLDGEYDENKVVPDEEFNGGIPWDLVKIKKVGK